MFNRKFVRFFNGPFKSPRSQSGQAVIEIALFGAILIFLIGVILRTHLSHSFSTNHQVRAMKLALQQSYLGSVGKIPNSSRNSASILFIEDRLSPDLNKFAAIERNPFVANGSGTMTDRLNYPIDFGEVGHNLPIMDIFVNGQHFPLTVGAYVFRVIYPQNDTDAKGDACPPDFMGPDHGPEFIRCLRQEHEWKEGSPTFYQQIVNGTQDYNPLASKDSWDLLRNNWDKNRLTKPITGNVFSDDVDEGIIRNYIAWQWKPIKGVGSSLDFGSDDNPNYPSMDFLGNLREQTAYYVSQKPVDKLLAILSSPSLAFYEINPGGGGSYAAGNSGYVLSLTDELTNAPTGFNFTNPKSCDTGNGMGVLCLTRAPSAGNITGVVVLDNQAGDIDLAYDDKTSPGPKPGLMQQMAIYSWVVPPDGKKQGTFMQIKEGKLYNPETHQVVRSISSKDHVDLISRMFQLSNNTQRFCKTSIMYGSTPVPYLADQSPDANHPVPNPVEACGECNSKNINKTCFDPASRILFIRTLIGDATTRKWFTDVTKGL